MCGRYTHRLSWREIRELYRLTLQTAPNIPARYNVAPTQDVLVVRLIAGTKDREFVMLRWGLIPPWSKDLKMAATMINARAETLIQKPSFRTAFRRRRCLIVADGFYECRKLPSGKQPYFVTAKDGEPFAFAGLWERWEKAPDGRPVESCTIVTTEANEVLRPIHDRMPVLLSPGDFDAWLDTQAWPAEKAAQLLKPFLAERIVLVAVTTRVNNVRNDDPACIEPLS